MRYRDRGLFDIMGGETETLLGIAAVGNNAPPHQKPVGHCGVAIRCPG